MLCINKDLRGSHSMSYRYYHGMVAVMIWLFYNSKLNETKMMMSHVVLDFDPCRHLCLYWIQYYKCGQYWMIGIYNTVMSGRCTDVKIRTSVCVSKSSVCVCQNQVCYYQNWVCKCQNQMFEKRCQVRNCKVNFG